MRLTEADKRSIRQNLSPEEQAMFQVCHEMERPLLLAVGLVGLS
jgi:hypothetical protein